MARRGRRERVDRGIYRDGSGYEVVARGGGQETSRRFPPDIPLAVMQTWRDGESITLRSLPKPARDGKTFSAAIDWYIGDVGLSPKHPEHSALNWWKASKYGALERRTVSAALMVGAFEAMTLQHASGQTRYYRKLVVRKLWHACEGPKAATPVDDITVNRKKTRIPVWVPDTTIRTVLDNLIASEQAGRLLDSRTRARFMVLASCGQRPAQMKRAGADDIVFFDEPPKPGIYGLWNVQHAKGGDPIPVYLNAEQAYAWKFFIAADAWGSYDRRSFPRTIHHHGWPAGIRPYDVRHALGITASELGVPLEDLQAHMGHTDLKTTRSFYVPQRHSRLQQLARVVEGRFGSAWASAPARPKRVRRHGGERSPSG